MLVIRVSVELKTHRSISANHKLQHPWRNLTAFLDTTKSHPMDLEQKFKHPLFLISTKIKNKINTIPQVLGTCSKPGTSLNWDKKIRNCVSLNGFLIDLHLNMWTYLMKMYAFYNYLHTISTRMTTFGVKDLLRREKYRKRTSQYVYIYIKLYIYILCVIYKQVKNGITPKVTKGLGLGLDKWIHGRCHPSFDRSLIELMQQARAKWRPSYSSG